MDAGHGRRLRHRIGRGAILSIVFAAALGGASSPASAQFPDWSGRWTDLNTGRWDPSKPPNKGQQAPLIPEYQPKLDAAMANRAEGGRGNTPTISCGHTGMPRAMLVYETMEIVIKPDVTYMLFDFLDPLRRVFTDGRNWPAAADPTWVGYSIGHWEGTGGEGKYDTLAIETRNFKGPRIIDGSGIPLHEDNQTVIRERMSLDRDNPDKLNDEITLIDHAFTRPWTVTRSYKRQRNPVWAEYDCHENNEHVIVGSEAYLISADGYLMPTRKGQPPPDARYFKKPEK
ncbi:MAG TPA: hypothetical protein VIY51_02235 [Xanthobacteraceae bacterium]